MNGDKRFTKIKFLFHLKVSPNSIKKVIKYSDESFWVVFDQIGTAIGSIFTIKIMTNILSPEEFGYLTLSNIIVFLITSSLFGPIGQSFMRFWSIAKEKQEMNNFYFLVNHFLKRAFFIASIGSIIAGFFLLKGSDNKWPFLIVLSLLIAACTGWTTTRTFILMAARRRKIVALIHVGGAFLRALAAAVLAIMLGRKASIALLGNLLAVLIFWAFVENYFKRFIHTEDLFESKGPKKLYFNNPLFKQIFVMATYFLLWSIFSWIKSSTDRWALQLFYGPETVASFNVVLQLANLPIILMSGFLTTFFNPIAFQLAGDLNNKESSTRAYELLVKMFFLYSIGVIVIIVGYVFYHNQLTFIISNKKYTNLSYLLPMITLGVSLYQCGEILASCGVLFNKLQAYLAPKIITSTITGISLFLFSKLFGPIGVMWGLIIAGILYTPWSIIVTLKILKGIRESD